MVTNSPSLDMLKGEQIAAANLTDWRELAQGLHARYVVDDFGTGARFVAAVAERPFTTAPEILAPHAGTHYAGKLHVMDGALVYLAAIVDDGAGSFRGDLSDRSR